MIHKKVGDKFYLINIIFLTDLKEELSFPFASNEIEVNSAYKIIC